MTPVDLNDARYQERYVQQGVYTIALFPQTVLELNTELGTYHETLAREIQATPGDWITKVVAVATKLNIEVDGSYTRPELARLAEICTLQLMQYRTSIILM